MKHSLSTNGLSLSQAQSISNLMHQRAQDIVSSLNSINNAEKTLTLNNEKYVETVGNKMPTNVVALIQEKAILHSAQAFLMENLKAKEEMLNEIKRARYQHPTASPDVPETFDLELLDQVSEEWGWNQLTSSEYAEYLEAEAYAAHIGQFIHNGSKLDKLRKELSTLKTLEWIEVESGKKTPLKVSIHHTQDELLKIHNELATMHRQHEQRVNYYKAKVKNLVSDENARIAQLNTLNIQDVEIKNKQLFDKYRADMDAYNAEVQSNLQKFESERQTKLKEVSGLRIVVDTRFKTVIDSYMSMMAPEA